MIEIFSFDKLNADDVDDYNKFFECLIPYIHDIDLNNYTINGNIIINYFDINPNPNYYLDNQMLEELKLFTR